MVDSSDAIRRLVLDIMCIIGALGMRPRRPLRDRSRCVSFARLVGALPNDLALLPTTWRKSVRPRRFLLRSSWELSGCLCRSLIGSYEGRRDAHPVQRSQYFGRTDAHRSLLDGHFTGRLLPRQATFATFVVDPEPTVGDMAPCIEVERYGRRPVVNLNARAPNRSRARCAAWFASRRHQSRCDRGR